jgi:hypothetical protein
VPFWYATQLTTIRGRMMHPLAGQCTWGVFARRHLPSRRRA